MQPDDAPRPYLHTVWADDIRYELGNKVSIMGVYANDIVLPGLPASLPKLLCYSTLSIPTGHWPKRVQYRLLMDDTVLMEQTLDMGPEPPPSVPGRPVSGNRLVMAVGLGPIELPVGVQSLGSEAELDGRVLNGSKLWVVIAEPEPRPESIPERTG